MSTITPALDVRRRYEPSFQRLEYALEKFLFPGVGSSVIQEAREYLYGEEDEFVVLNTSNETTALFYGLIEPNKILNIQGRGTTTAEHIEVLENSFGEIGEDGKIRLIISHEPKFLLSVAESHPDVVRIFAPLKNYPHANYRDKGFGTYWAPKTRAHSILMPQKDVLQRLPYVVANAFRLKNLDMDLSKVTINQNDRPDTQFLYERTWS